MQAPPTALIFSSATLLKNLGTESTMRTVCQATRSSQGLVDYKRMDFNLEFVDFRPHIPYASNSTLKTLATPGSVA